MKRFDVVFEKSLCRLLEKEYVSSTFEDNVRALVKILDDNDFLLKNKTTEQHIQTVLSQTDNVKQILLSTKEQSMPAMKLRVQQDPDTESFSVTVINLEKPNEQKEFNNSMLETIFDDVIQYIKMATLQNVAPEAAVEQIPLEKGAEQQPGAEQSALPTK